MSETWEIFPIPPSPLSARFALFFEASISNVMQSNNTLKSSERGSTGRTQIIHKEGLVHISSELVPPTGSGRGRGWGDLSRLWNEKKARVLQIQGP